MSCVCWPSTHGCTRRIVHYLDLSTFYSIYKRFQSPSLTHICIIKFKWKSKVNKIFNIDFHILLIEMKRFYGKNQTVNRKYSQHSLKKDENKIQIQFNASHVPKNTSLFFPLSPCSYSTALIYRKHYY